MGVVADQARLVKAGQVGYVEVVEVAVDRQAIPLASKGPAGPEATGECGSSHVSKQVKGYGNVG